MNPRIRLIAGIACWAGPLLVGVAVAALIAIMPQGGEVGRGNREGISLRPDPTDLERLQGPWIATSVERDGVPVLLGEEAGRARVTFVDEEVTFFDGDVILRGTYRLDPTASPKTFDLIVPEDGASRSYPAGIYSLDDSAFRLCFAFPARERPTQFATGPGLGQTYFVYRRDGLDNRATRGGWPGSVLVGLALTTSLRGPERDAAPSKRTWDFESDEPGMPAKGITGEVGRWVVAQDGKNRVLAQKAMNEDSVFNVALAGETSYKDLDLSVRMRAVEGETDRGGGLVWRAKDKDNYYVCRYNPLKGASYRVYKVVAGKRTQFQALVLPEDLEWHTLRVVMKGSRMTCYFDGKKCLEVDDDTFPDAGKVGLWSKSDARSYFDDLAVAEPE